MNCVDSLELIYSAIHVNIPFLTFVPAVHLTESGASVYVLLCPSVRNLVDGHNTIKTIDGANSTRNWRHQHPTHTETISRTLCRPMELYDGIQ